MGRQYFISSVAGQQVCRRITPLRCAFGPLPIADPPAAATTEPRISCPCPWCAQKGPFELPGLERLWSIGQLTAAATVWYDGQPGWLPLENIPELCQRFCPELATAAAPAAAAAAPSAAGPSASGPGPGSAGGGGPAAAAAAAGGAQTQYVMENGYQTYTDPSSKEKWVWDDSRSEWLPHEQAMYMLGFDGAVAEKPPANPDEDEIDKRIQAARPIDMEMPLLQPGMLDDSAAKEAAAKDGGGSNGKAKAKRSIIVNPNATQDAAGGGSAAAAAEALEPEPPPGPPFVAAAEFDGARPGYMFQAGGEGVGYYWDGRAAETRKRKRAEAMSEEERQARNKKKTEWRKKKKAETWSDSKVNSYIYITGLPADCTEGLLAAHFSKFGMIRQDPLTDKPLLKLYRDKQTSKVKGDARLSFVKEESTDLAISLADESEIKPGFKLTVQRAEFEQKGGDYVKRQKVQLTDEQKKRLELKKREEQSKLSWNEGIDDGRGLKIVVLKNVFHPDDARAAYNYYDELYDEVRGHVPSVRPPARPAAFRCLARTMPACSS
eukprot:SAG22_NODE_192_length_15668_cov_4.492389_3_plen_549_part_00